MRGWQMPKRVPMNRMDVLAMVAHHERVAALCGFVRAAAWSAPTAEV
jgi:hypothetical protein